MTESRGEWGHLSFEPFDFVKDYRGPVSTVSEAFSGILQEAQVVLNLAKSFTPSYIDPLAGAISTLENEIKGLIEDLRQFGLYITGDWPLLVDSFEGVRGGFDMFEQRMVTRLTDRTDPTRPNLSPKSELLGVFLYQSVPGYEIHKLLTLFNGLQQLLHLDFGPTGAAFPTPQVTGFAYGPQAVDVLTPKSLERLVTLKETPRFVKIKWTVPSTQLQTTYSPVPPVGFTGFIVSVSTSSDGIPLVWDRPKANVLKEKDKAQPREYGKVLDQTGKPVVLFGGVEELSIPHNWKYAFNTSFDGNNIKDGVSRIYGVKGSDPKHGIVPLEALSSSPYLFQRLFYVDAGVLDPNWVKNEYSITLDLNDLPLEADIKTENGRVSFVNERRPTTYYARVASTSGEITEFKYDLSSTKVEAGSDVVAEVLSSQGPQVRSAWSASSQMVLPAQDTGLFLQAIFTALEVLVLCRADLPTENELEHIKGATLLNNTTAIGVAKRRTGLERFRQLITPLGLNDLFDEVGQSPLHFRQRCYTAIKKLSYELFVRGHISPKLQEFVIQNTKNLRGVQVKELISDTRVSKGMNGDFGLLDLIAQEPFTAGAVNVRGSLPSARIDWGVAANPLSIGLVADIAPKVFRMKGLIEKRSPHFADVSENVTFVQQVVAPDQVEVFLSKTSPAQRLFYEKCRQTDGSLVLNPEQIAYMQSLADSAPQGESDLYPVFYSGSGPIRVADLDTTEIKGGMAYCRTVLAEYKSGILIDEAIIALGVLASVRQPQDGQWLNIRFLDAFPEMGDVTLELLNWIGSLSAAVTSAGNVVDAYTDFMQARINELQSMATRIDSLLGSIASVKLNFPAISGLKLISKGTEGLTQDFMRAENKPKDDSTDYGAGICIVAPIIPPMLDSLITISSTSQSSTSLASLFDVDAIPVVVLPGPDDPPEPL